MVIYLSLALVIVGGLMYYFNMTTKTPTARTAAFAELGRIMFGCGLLAIALEGDRILAVLRRVP